MSKITVNQQNKNCDTKLNEDLNFSEELNFPEELINIHFSCTECSFPIELLSIDEENCIIEFKCLNKESHGKKNYV